MPVFTESSSEHMKWRKPRSHLIQPISETDPILQPRSCKPTTTISSLLLSSFSNEASPSSSSSSSFFTKKKTANKFRGLGCAASASQQVSVPAVIRSSADCDGGDDKKVKKKKKKKEKKTNEKSQVGAEGLNSVVACMDFQDVWCGPGAGFSGESGDGSVDCVVARRNVNSGRGKIDCDHHHIRMNSHHHRERVCLTRRTVSPDTISFLDSEPEPEFLISRPGSEVFGRRCYRNVRHASPEGLAEIMMFQSSLMMGGRLDIDRYRGWRLDVDNMTYEQLLELGERIGYVSTGLANDEIRRCVQKIKLPTVGDQVKNGKCIICQEEYESDDVEGEEMGKVLNCGHAFHFKCIEQWLTHKNTCPFCKVEAATKC